MPNATIVRPTTRCDTPLFSATPTPPSISKSAPFTKKAAPTINSVAMTLSVDGDADGAEQQAVCWTLKNPSTGVQTLAWDWAGAGTPSEGLVYTVVYISGEHDSSFVGATAVDQTRTTGNTTGSMAANSGDLFLGCANSFAAGDNITWTNATERIGSLQASNWGEMADATPSGAITVSTTSGSAFSCLIGIIIVQVAAGGISIPVVMQQMDQFDGGAML